jgi:hypothetical protein
MSADDGLANEEVDMTKFPMTAGQGPTPVSERRTER